MTAKSDADDRKARGLDPENVPNEGGAALHTDAVVGLGLNAGYEEAQVFPPADQVRETAIALNDAAADLGLTHRVQWQGDHFLVPLEVADKAKLPKGANETAVPDQGGTTALPTVVRDLGQNDGTGVTAVEGSAAAGKTGADSDLPPAARPADSASKPPAKATSRSSGAHSTK